jgi:predicted DCC family thiol-disulfide oxidoreductase YuxK
MNQHNQAIVFFDAQCSLCWRTQKLLASWGQSTTLQFVPLQHFKTYQQQFKALETILPEELRQGIRVFEISTDKLYVGVAGVGYCLQHCRFPFSLLGWLLTLPWLQPLLIPLYEWVARNRTRFLPPLSPEEEERLYEELSRVLTN